MSDCEILKNVKKIISDFQGNRAADLIEEKIVNKLAALEIYENGYGNTINEYIIDSVDISYNFYCPACEKNHMGSV